MMYDDDVTPLEPRRHAMSFEVWIATVAIVHAINDLGDVGSEPHTWWRKKWKQGFAPCQAVMSNMEWSVRLYAPTMGA